MPDTLTTWAREAERQPFDAAAWNRLPNWQNGNLIAPSKLRTASGILGSEWDPSTPRQTMRVNTRFFNNTTGIGETTDDLDFRMFNQRWISGRNAAGNATVNMLRLNGTNQIELGAAANDLVVPGPAFLNGNVTLGNAATDLISVLGTLTVTPLATFLAGISITLGGLAFAASTPGQRITADFTSTPTVNRTMFQTSTVNGVTGIDAMPNGTGIGAAFEAFSASNPAASARLAVYAGVTDHYLLSDHTGAAYLPLSILVGGLVGAKFQANGDLIVGSGTGVKIGAYGAAGAVQPTAAAAATDLATVITLANSLRTGLRAIGWFA